MRQRGTEATQVLAQISTQVPTKERDTGVPHKTPKDPTRAMVVFRGRLRRGVSLEVIVEEDDGQDTLSRRCTRVVQGGCAVWVHRGANRAFRSWIGCRQGVQRMYRNCRELVCVWTSLHQPPPPHSRILCPTLHTPTTCLYFFSN